MKALIVLVCFAVMNINMFAEGACDTVAGAKCSTDYASAVGAAGSDKTKLCAAISTYTACLKTSDCATTALTDSIANSLKAAGCSGTMVHFSVSVIIMSLFAAFKHYF